MGNTVFPLMGMLGYGYGFGFPYPRQNHTRTHGVTGITVLVRWSHVSSNDFVDQRQQQQQWLNDDDNCYQHAPLVLNASGGCFFF